MKLGRYEVVRELGKGAMGIVYLAKDPLIGRLVALKTIRPSSSDDDEAKEFQERFVREAQAAGILNHPSIVTVHDIGQDPESGISFIAMEYIEGLNLKEILQQGKGMHFFEVGEIVAQVADALDYAHSKGIIHRDVKPANIILPTESKAKITDFGIAKIASGAANLTTTGQFLGTPNYMAPEQIKGSRIDGRSDLFSLGIVFYECLARRKPFGGDSLTTISYKIVHEPFPPLHEIDPSIPEGFEEIVGRCLAKDPTGRYQRGRDMAADIRSVVRGEGVSRPVDLSAFEETLMSRDGSEKIPTIEIPFPEADATTASASDPGILISDGPVVAGAALARETPRGARARKPAGPRTSFIAKKVSAPIFFGVVAVMLIPLAVIIAAIMQRKVQVPVVDHRKEKVAAKQRRLRLDAEAMMDAHNFEGAYERYLELQRLAPNSPIVNSRLQELQQIRSAQLNIQQRLAQANATFEQGKQLYDAKDYNNAIPLFEQAFHLNPNNGEAVNFLKMSREQLSIQQQAQAGERVAVSAAQQQQARQQPARGRTASGGTTSRTAVKGTATLVTSFKSPVKDGYLMVKVNGQTLVYENLWEESHGLFRRKVTRDIMVSSQVSSENNEVEVWVVVPSLKLQEHRQFRQLFPAGGQRSLTITLDTASNKVEIQWT